MTDKRKWHSGPPPHVGWWNANTSRHPFLWRWWNGNHWSRPASSRDSPKAAAVEARVPATASGIEWADYWPEDARVPRIAP